MQTTLDHQETNTGPIDKTTISGSNDGNDSSAAQQDHMSLQVWDVKDWLFLAASVRRLT